LYVVTVDLDAPDPHRSCSLTLIKEYDFEVVYF
jgi:hypothetical protein